MNLKRADISICMSRYNQQNYDVRRCIRARAEAGIVFGGDCGGNICGGVSPSSAAPMALASAACVGIAPLLESHQCLQDTAEGARCG